MNLKDNWTRTTIGQATACPRQASGWRAGYCQGWAYKGVDFCPFVAQMPINAAWNQTVRTERQRYRYKVVGFSSISVDLQRDVVQYILQNYPEVLQHILQCHCKAGSWRIEGSESRIVSYALVTDCDRESLRIDYECKTCKAQLESLLPILERFCEGSFEKIKLLTWKPQRQRVQWKKSE